MQRILILFSMFLMLSVVSPQGANAVVPVPPGNRNVEQPKIPAGSIARTRSTKGDFQEKYEKIRDLIANDRKLKTKIKAAARRFGIAPIHIVGALVGEHTYNVDAIDRLQTYYVKAISYFKSDVTFSYGNETVSRFVRRPEFAQCAGSRDSYDLWTCRESVWNRSFRGKIVDGINWPNDRFGKVFFQPFYAGQTFGLGQINPLTALRVTDLVAKTTGEKTLSANKANEVYKTIMDPDTTLLYMAAVLRVAIDSYRDLSDFDITDNPGITATLYNLGDVRNRARKANRRESLPEENYYGWLVNEKRAELEAILR